MYTKGQHAAGTDPGPSHQMQSGPSPAQIPSHHLFAPASPLLASLASPACTTHISTAACVSLQIITMKRISWTSVQLPGHQAKLTVTSHYGCIMGATFLTKYDSSSLSQAMRSDAPVACSHDVNLPCPRWASFQQSGEQRPSTLTSDH